jgi:hypothetical protein
VLSLYEMSFINGTAAIAISSSRMRVNGISKSGMANFDRAEDHVDIVVAA